MPVWSIIFVLENHLLFLIYASIICQALPNIHNTGRGQDFDTDQAEHWHGRLKSPYDKLFGGFFGYTASSFTQ